MEVVDAPRTCNWVTHKLARLGANIGDGLVSFWLGTTQIDVIPLVANYLLSAENYGKYFPSQKKGKHSEIAGH